MSASVADLEHAFSRVCLDREPSSEHLDLLHGEPDRWTMYRHMVRHRLISMIRSGLPLSSALLGEARFEDDVAAYLEERGPKSRYIREVVHELVEHAYPGWQADADLPPHLLDLVRYEAMKWRVGSLEERIPEGMTELDFERTPVFNATARTLYVEHRVDKDAESPPRLDAPHLSVVYRRPGSARVCTYVLNPVGAMLYCAWRDGAEQGANCADGVRGVLASLNREADARFIDGMAGVLADLVEQQVVLGSLP